VTTAHHPPDPFLYQAAVVRVVTPVTYDLQVDVGFRMSREVRVTLRGVELPDDYDPSNGDHRMLSAVTNWFEAAAAPDDVDDFPLWIRTYRHTDPGSGDGGGGQPGEDLYEVDAVRKCDADNLRVYLTDKWPDIANGIDGDQFDFFRGRNDTETDDPDQ
jgi:hypothetical protein